MPVNPGHFTLVDGTLIACACYPGCAARGDFAGFARYGFVKSQHCYVWGVRLVLLSDCPGARERRLSRVRLKIESVYSNLKRQMRLEQRPPRARLAAYDGS